MKIILLGAPGAGKGTAAQRLAKDFSIPHISTGDIFRKNIKEMTALGMKVKSILDSGKLVPDDVTIEIVRDRLSQPDCENGYILDGFPRSLAQAQAFDSFVSIDYVINLAVATSALVKRLTGRRVCPTCSTVYHIATHKSAMCDKGCGEVITRVDDMEETVLNRINVYNETTKPLEEHYAQTGKLVNVDANMSIDEAYQGILEVLKK